MTAGSTTERSLGQTVYFKAEHNNETRQRSKITPNIKVQRAILETRGNSTSRMGDRRGRELNGVQRLTDADEFEKSGNIGVGEGMLQPKFAEATQNLLVVVVNVAATARDSESLFAT